RDHHGQGQRLERIAEELRKVDPCRLVPGVPKQPSPNSVTVRKKQRPGTVKSRAVALGDPTVKEAGTWLAPDRSPSSGGLLGRQLRSAVPLAGRRQVLPRQLGVARIVVVVAHLPHLLLVQVHLVHLVTVEGTSPDAAEHRNLATALVHRPVTVERSGDGQRL